MAEIPKEDVCALIRGAAEGHLASAADLLPLVYEQLRAIAHAQRRERFGADTLRTTALVHEAFLKLAGPTELKWEGRAHFLAVAATAMRHVLSDYARGSKAAKRGGAWGRVTLGPGADVAQASGSDSVDLVALDSAMTRLSQIDQRQSRIVEMRYLSGMSVAETAKVLGTTTRTVEREWRVARAWLSHAITSGRDA